MHEVHVHVGFRDWEGEPSKKKGYDCGMVVFEGNYHQVNCDNKLSYICERYATGYSTGKYMYNQIPLYLYVVIF